MNTIVKYNGPVNPVTGFTNHNPNKGEPVEGGEIYNHYYDQCEGDEHTRRRFSIVCLYDIHGLSTPQVASHVPSPRGSITPQSLSCYKVRVVKRCGGVNLTCLMGDSEWEVVDEG